MRYYYNLDFLKIVFMILVILYHFIRGMGFWYKGSIDLFFIVSGFLCAVTFKKDLSVIDFIKRKCFLFMPFLIISILTLIPLKEFSIHNILNNIFLNFVWKYDFFVPVAWYLNVWFWLSLCLFYLQKTYSRGRCNLVVSFSVFIA